MALWPCRLCCAGLFSPSTAQCDLLEPPLSRLTQRRASLKKAAGVEGGGSGELRRGRLPLVEHIEEGRSLVRRGGGGKG